MLSYMTQNSSDLQPNTRKNLRGEVLILAAILIVAAWFRLYQLNQVPPGLTHDEANNAHDAIGVLAGHRSIYFPTGYGHEPLYTYLVALVSLPAGVTPVTLRLATALCGLGVLAGSYALARRAFDRWVAAAAACGLAVSFWPVFSQRQGVRPVTLPLLFVPATLFLWRGLSGAGRRRDWALAGFFAGAAFYTYLASRVLLPVFAVLALYLALFHREKWQQSWRGFLLMLLVAAAVAAPLAIHLITHPAAEVRVGQLTEPLAEARRGNLEPLLQNALSALKVFSFTGDTHWRYNLPGRPLFDPLTSVFLYLGLALTLWRWRQPVYAFLLMWLGAGLFPALVTGAMNSSQRTLGAQPAVFIILALGVVSAARWLWARGRAARWAAALGALALLGANAWTTAHDYFIVWAAEPDVREVYHTNLRQIARYLDDQPEGGTVAISTEYPAVYHDPYILEATLRREDLSPRWFDARGALVLPRGGSVEARYILQAATPPHPALARAFFEDKPPLTVQRLRPDDINDAFTVYRLSLVDQLARRLSAARENPVAWSSAIEFKPGDTAPLAWPVDLGHQAALLGYELDRMQMAPGETLQLVTYWRVLARPKAQATIFAHLLDAGSQVAAGQDRLDAPTAHWQPGDVVVQIHTLIVKPGTGPGLYQLEIGLYNTDDLARWPVFEGGAPVADRLLLHPIEVTAP